MTLALLDAHFEADLGSDKNPYRSDEVFISRLWNWDLFCALEALEFFEVERCFIDHHRPQDRDVAFDLKLKAVRRAGAALCCETHCNFHESPAVHGWIVMVHRGDAMSWLLGETIRDAWAGVLVNETIRIVEVPDPRYTYSRLFHQLDKIGCSFVLPELGNIGITKTRSMLKSRGQIYRRLVEATASALKGVLADEE